MVLRFPDGISAIPLILKISSGRNVDRGLRTSFFLQQENRLPGLITAAQFIIYIGVGQGNVTDTDVCILNVSNHRRIDLFVIDKMIAALDLDVIDLQRRNNDQFQQILILLIEFGSLCADRRNYKTSVLLHSYGLLM